MSHSFGVAFNVSATKYECVMQVEINYDRLE